MRIAIGIAALLGLVAVALWQLPKVADRRMNPVAPHAPYLVSEDARAFHESLFVADLHADSLLWDRDLLRRNDRGHLDLPRMEEGNLSLQVMTIVSQSPRGLNLEQNAAEAPDDITLLAIFGRWPIDTWRNLLPRGLYQAEKLQTFATRSGGRLVVVRNRRDLAALPPDSVGAILGVEGLHLLEGRIDNLDRLIAAGVRVMGLVHFFDNEIGGSLHGLEKGGLTLFGDRIVRRLEAEHMVIDLAHASEAVVHDVLAVTARPPILSHTGFRGHCDSERNLPDDLMRLVAMRGGLVGVGFWAEAVCDPSPAGIARALGYGVDLLGADHVALGSDFDGAVRTALDASELAAVTAALLEMGMDPAVIRKVMGGNARRFFSRQLPE